MLMPAATQVQHAEACGGMRAAGEDHACIAPHARAHMPSTLLPSLAAPCTHQTPAAPAAWLLQESSPAGTSAPTAPTSPSAPPRAAHCRQPRRRCRPAQSPAGAAARQCQLEMLPSQRPAHLPPLHPVQCRPAAAWGSPGCGRQCRAGGAESAQRPRDAPRVPAKRATRGTTPLRRTAGGCGA